VIYENCVFPNFAGKKGTFVNCTIQPGAEIGGDVYFTDCTFKALDGATEISLNMPYDSDRVFKNCEFLGRTNLSSKGYNTGICFGTFSGCEFEDVKIYLNLSVADSTNVTMFDKCTLNSTVDNFLYIGPFVYSLGITNIEFKDSTINHTGDNLIYLYAKPRDDSWIRFNNCKINKSNGTLITGYSMSTSANDISLSVLFENGTTVDKNLAVDSHINPDTLKIFYGD
jgi:hypothetical protein